MAHKTEKDSRKPSIDWVWVRGREVKTGKYTETLRLAKQRTLPKFKKMRCLEYLQQLAKKPFCDYGNGDKHFTMTQHSQCSYGTKNKKNRGKVKEADSS